MKNLFYIFSIILIAFFSSCSQKKTLSEEDLEYSLAYIKLKIADSITLNDTKTIAANNVSYHCKISSFYNTGILWSTDKPISFSLSAKTFYIAPFEIPVGDHSIFSVEILDNKDSLIYAGVTEEASGLQRSLSPLPLDVTIEYPTREKPTNIITIPVISKEEIKASAFLFNVFNPNFLKGYSLPIAVSDCPNSIIKKITANTIYRDNISDKWHLNKPLAIDKTYRETDNMYEVSFIENMAVDNNLEGMEISISMSDNSVWKGCLSIARLIQIMEQTSGLENKVWTIALRNSSIFVGNKQNYPADPKKPNL
ncbi:MAG: hypothetical protein Q4F97_09520 [Bacteroidales bacterium]|nr:hypothetical protein [Bacteroidales bacterium]